MIAHSVKSMRRHTQHIVRPRMPGLITQVSPMHVPIEDVPLKKLPEAINSFLDHRGAKDQLAIIIRPTMWKDLCRTCPADGDSPEEIFRKANVAVYLAVSESAVKRAITEIVHYFHDRAVIYWVHRAE